MNVVMLTVVAVILVACKKLEPLETVDALATHPERLKELRAHCKERRSTTDEELCSRVAEATRRQFLGDGVAPYTPPKEQPKF